MQVICFNDSGEKTMSCFVDYPVTDNYRKVYTSSDIHFNSCSNCARKCGRERSDKFVCDRHKSKVKRFVIGGKK